MRLVLFILILLTQAAAAQNDPFQWLEERSGPRVGAFVADQNSRTKARFSGPRYDFNLAAAASILASEDQLVLASETGDSVTHFLQDGAHPLGLLRRTSAASYVSGNTEWEPVLDFDALAKAEGVDWVFRGSVCLKPDYVQCLVSLSPDGGDAAEIREFDMQEKQFIAEGFRLPASKSDASWVDADTILIASALGEEDQTESGYPGTLKLLKRGQAFSAAEVLQRAEPGDLAVYGYEIDGPGGNPVLLTERWIGFYESAFQIAMPGGAMTALPLPANGAWLAFHGQMLVRPAEDWQPEGDAVYKAGGLYAFDLEGFRQTGEIGAVDMLAEPGERSAIAEFASNRDHVFVLINENVRGRVMAFEKSAAGWTGRRLALPEGGTITMNHANEAGASVSFTYEDLLTPPTLYWSDDNGETLTPILAQKAFFDASSHVAEQFEAISKDGTRIPYFVARPKDQTAPVPAMIYGYGGFEETMAPWYSGMRGLMWLTRGRAFILANIRGGGEFGPSWHQAAIRGNRQRAFDDFAAVARDAMARGITTAPQLVAKGGSNGGLLAGVMLTQQPELFGAISSEVPLLDMLRYDQLPPGDSWMDEYGDPSVPADAAFLKAYSPYHNVVPGRKYPPVLFSTSTADDRVHPAHARKMAALMQSLGHPAFLAEETEGGHGGEGDILRQAESAALFYTFAETALGLDGGEPVRAADGLALGALRAGLGGKARADQPASCQKQSAGSILGACADIRQRFSAPPPRR